MNAHKQSPSDWRRLFTIACSLISQVNKDHPIIEDWTFGGGTAMMLQIGHRESRDVDIFLPDPQYLSFLNPDTQNLEFEIVPSAYSSDGARVMKFAFEKIGEIDFIVAPTLTKNPAGRRDIEGISTLLETVPEIIAKKVFFRGDLIQPRDIFDIAAAARACGDDVINALAQYPQKADVALRTMGALNPDFVDAVISKLMITDEYKGVAHSALGDAIELLKTSARSASG